MKRAAAAVIGLTLVLLTAPADARTLSSRPVTFSAPVPCTVVCAYWLDQLNNGQTGTMFDACRKPFPAGSYADVVVRAPLYARTLTFEAFPKVDWDIFICSKPSRGNNGSTLAIGANDATSCAAACKERAVIPVRPYRYYVLRAYNWSDPSSLPARYTFRT